MPLDPDSLSHPPSKFFGKKLEQIMLRGVSAGIHYVSKNIRNAPDCQQNARTKGKTK
jgi:hypothetical protein